MTVIDHRPTAPSDEARALLAEAAADYKATETRRRRGLDHRDDAELRTRAARTASDQYARAAGTRHAH
ncbi:hypothetical protein ACGFWI_01150 [Streptomyces sp. NPDC048434]|uniref:hypothetical protein n=1 Tax=Streptomyces sp. NPDC048434 TaxID=3365549 RepID=UPI00371A07F7